MANTKENKRPISEIIIGDTVLACGFKWKVRSISKAQKGLYRLELFCEETGEKKTVRKVPGTVRLEVL